jgi:hypothetical protein
MAAAGRSERVFGGGGGAVREIKRSLVAAAQGSLKISSGTLPLHMV